MAETGTDAWECFCGRCAKRIIESNKRDKIALLRVGVVAWLVLFWLLWYFGFSWKAEHKGEYGMVLLMVGLGTVGYLFQRMDEEAR